MSNTKDLSVDEMINQFIDKMMVEMGMDKKMEGEANVLAQFKKDLRERFDDRLNATILSQIPENKLEEFENLLDADDEKGLQEFCVKNIPSFPELITSELLSFRNRYISQ
jgi:hypothetical protein